MYITLSKVQITPNYNSGIFHIRSLKSISGSTNYSSFLKLDHKPDYILTSENELYWFYRSSVAFNFFNTGLLDQVIMKQVNEGANQTLVLNHNYTLTKKAGCYQFLVTFHGYYSCDYYGYHYGNTITLNIRIIPDYDFSQGLNAVTLNNISKDYSYNYVPLYFHHDL